MDIEPLKQRKPQKGAGDRMGLYVNPGNGAFSGPACEHMGHGSEGCGSAISAQGGGKSGL